MIDWNFLLILAGSLLIGVGAMAAGYYAGKHNAYMEMLDAEIKDRHENMRRQVEELGNSDRSNSNHRIG